MADNRATFTLRLPPELHDKLRLHAYITRKPINETLTELVAEFLDEGGRGREEMVDAAGKQAAEDHRGALDALRDM